MATLEGLWDCTCGRKRIPGLTKICPDCGDPRNVTLTPSEAPYLPSDARVITDPDERKQAAAGPDWNCGKCGTANDGNVKKCASCGKSRTKRDFVNPIKRYLGGKAAQGAAFSDPDAPARDRADDIIGDPLQEALDTVSGDINKPRKPRIYTLPAAAANKAAQTATRVQDYRVDRKERLNFWERWGLNVVMLVVAGVAVVAFAIGGYAFYDNFIKTEAKDLTVTSLSWERRMEIEELKTFTEEDWSVPSGGREIRNYRAVHHTEREVDYYITVEHRDPYPVSDGFATISQPCGSTMVDNGNGTFDTETVYCDVQVEQFHTEYNVYTTQEPVYKDVPVYRTKYVYEIDRWVTDRWVTTSGEAGGAHPTPYFAEDPELQPRERIGNERQESYEVILEIDERTFKRNIEFSTWNNLELGEKVTGHMTKRGTLRKIDWPKE